MTYIIEQKLATLVNQYRVYDTDESGAKLNIVAFAQQKRFAFKEQINFYDDETKSRLIFSVKAEKVMDVHGKFLVVDDSEQTIGAIRKSFKSSLFRSTWEIIHDDQVYLTVQERSLNMAISRRLWGFIPFISELPFFFKLHFDFVSGNPQKLMASYDKLTLFRDNYKLTVLDNDVLETIGWQTLVAQAVMLDALQGR